MCVYMLCPALSTTHVMHIYVSHDETTALALLGAGCVGESPCMPPSSCLARSCARMRAELHSAGLSDPHAGRLRGAEPPRSLRDHLPVEDKTTISEAPTVSDDELAGALR